MARLDGPGMRPAQRARQIRGATALTAVLGLVAALFTGLMLAAASPAGAEDEGITLTKGVIAADPNDIAISNVAGVTGEVFTYSLTYRCSTFNPGGCTDVTLSDTLDPALEVVSAPSGWTVTDNGPAGTAIVAPIGAVTGNGTVSFDVRFRTNTSLPAGATVGVDNVATATGKIGTTSYPATSNTVSVTGKVRPVGGATATKTASPTSVIEFTDHAVDFTITGRNTGTIAADSLTVTDLDADFFPAFDVTSIGAPTLPTGATAALVEVTTDGTTWTTVTVSPYYPGAHLAGIRVTYTGAIAPAASGSLPFTATLRDTLSTGGEVVTGASKPYINDITAATHYASDPTLDRTGTGSATVTVVGEVINPPTLTKTFAPSTVTSGYAGTVTTTLAAKGVGSGGLSSLTISDPHDPTAPVSASNPSPFGSTLLLNGTVTLTWPANAEQATFTVYCAAGSFSTTITSGNPTIPAGCAASAITGFSVTFTSTTGDPIAANAAAKIAVVSTVSPTATNGSYLNDGRVAANGVSGNQNNATTIPAVPFTVSTPHAEIKTDKTFTRSDIRIGSPTQSNAIELPTTYGPSGTTPPTNIAADSVTIQDPTVLPTAANHNDFFDEFDLQSVRALDCQSGDVVTIRYYDGATWQTLAGNACSMTLPIDLTGYNAQGIQITYANPAGIAPGRTMKPELVVRQRLTHRDTNANILDLTTVLNSGDDPIRHESPRNCSTASATTGTATVTDAVDECPWVTSTRYPEGGGVGAEKAMNTADGTASGREGSQTQMTGTITLSNRPSGPATQLVVQDPPTGDLLPTTFAAIMDIVAVGPITVPAHERAKFQYLTLDAAGLNPVWADATSWVTGGSTLSAADNSAASGWRLVLEEDPASPGIDPGAIEEVTWDNVASLTIPFTYRLRDTFRTAVPGTGHVAGDLVRNNLCYSVNSTPMNENGAGIPIAGGGLDCQIDHAPFNGATWNASAGSNPTDAGWVLNDVASTATLAGGATETRTSSVLNDQVFRITNSVANATLTKAVTPNASVPVPATGQDPGPLQERTVVLTATNTSGFLVDNIDITEADATFWANFEFLDAAVAMPPGATDVRFAVSYSDATPDATNLTLAALNALSDKSKIDSIITTFSGNMGYVAPNNTGSVSLLVRLRPAITTPTSFTNHASVQARDPLSNSVVSPATRDIEVRAPGSVVQTSKDLALASGQINAVDLQPVLDATVRTTNSGELELSGLVNEDDDDVDPSQYPGTTLPPAVTGNVDRDFWAYTTFVGITAIAVPANAEQVAVEYWDGGPDWQSAGSWPAAGLAVATVNAALPVASVHGLRVTYTSTEGAAIHAGEYGEVKFQVRLKATAPVGDVLRNCAESAYTVGTALTRLNPVCADFTPQAGKASVDVSKVFTSTGVTTASDAAGTTQQYTLTVTNTGTQRLGTTASAPFAVIDTLAPQLSYKATTSITLPTGQSTLAGSPAPVVGAGTVTWTWPAGQYLAPTETVTIKVSLDLAPAIAPDLNIVNTVGVAMANADACSDANDKYRDGQCQASATLKVSAQGAIRATKTIQGTGVAKASADSTEPCPASGFVANPCVAVTPQGSTYTWKLDLLNSGNSQLGSLVLIDRLPASNDTGAYLGLQRGSEWRGIPTTAPTSNAQAGIAVTYQYLPASAAANLAACLAEAAGDPTCAQWVALPASTPIPADALGVRITANYGANANPLLLPGQRFTVTWDETAPDDLTLASDTRNANGQAIPDQRLEQWNSFGYSAAETGTGVTYRNESNKAGAIYDSADLKLAKVVQEQTLLTPADFGPYTLDYSCLTPGGSTVTGSTPLSDGQSATIYGLPTDTVCTITEQNAPAGFSWSPADSDAATAGYQIVIGPRFSTVTATLTNQIPVGQLVVTKSVLGALPAGVTSFPVTVSCTYRDKAVPLAAADASFSLVAGTPRTITGLPAGSSCTVSETSNGGADQTTVQVTGGTAAPVTIPDRTVVAIPAGSMQVDYVNNFGTNGLVVSKAKLGSLDPDYAVGPFGITVTCTDPNVAGPIVRNWTIAAGGSQSLTGLSNGTTCTITEPDSQNAHHVVIQESSGTANDGQVTFQGTGTAQTIAVQVRNTYDTGALSITKQLVGEPSVDSWTFDVTCTWQGKTVVKHVEVDATGTPVLLSGIPVGASCTVAEQDAGQDEVVFAPSGPYTIRTADSTVAVEATNSYLGELDVTKKVATSTVLTPAQVAALRFEITTVCTYDGDTVLDDTAEFADGHTEHYTDLPVGSTCTVTETKNGKANTTAITVLADPDADDAEAIDVAGDVAELEVIDALTEVTVTNTYTAAAVSVHKTVDGATVVGTFAFTVACTWQGAALTLPTGASGLSPAGAGVYQFALAADGTFTVAGLPTGSVCTVTETDTRSANRTASSAEGAVTGTATITVTADPATAGSDLVTAITFVNSYDPIPSGPTLAVTGSPARRDLQVGLAVLLAGVLMVIGARRRQNG